MQFYIETKEGDWEKDADYGYYYDHYFYLLYGADGKYEDDWFNANLKVETYYCMDNEEGRTPSPIIWDGVSE